MAVLGLTLNPGARITIQGGVEPPFFRVSAPIKGEHRREAVVSATEREHAYGFLMDTLVHQRPQAEIERDAIDELRAIGLLVPDDLAPNLVVYDLSEQAHASGARPAFVLSADMQARLRIPEAWRSQDLRFQAHRGGVWAPIRSDTPAALVDAIRTDNVELDPPDTKQFFAAEGFATLHNLLPNSHIQEMARYYWALADEGFMDVDNEGTSLRHFSHSDPIANFWLDQLNERVSQLVGHRTKPSYSFVSMYRAGGDLQWHTDRDPCEYTITVLLDYAPTDADGRSTWALKVRGRDGREHALYLRVGDALIFKGRELQHGRDVLSAGHRSASLLFHFVDIDYDGVMA